MAGPNLIWINVPDGESKEIPGGFIMASVNPTADATYTIRNSLAGDIGEWMQTSPSFDDVFTFPQCPKPEGYPVHTVTASGGAVIIGFINGN